MRRRNRRRRYLLRLPRASVTQGDWDDYGTFVPWGVERAGASTRSKLFCDVYQLGDGLHLHLFQDAFAVGLDGPLRVAEGGGNLLVQAAGNNEGEDLPLAGGESSVTRLQLRE